jgi:hypothetical protein
MEGRAKWPCENASNITGKRVLILDDEFIQKLAAALTAQLQPPIPVPIGRMWALFARILKRSEIQVRNGLIRLPISRRRSVYPSRVAVAADYCIA